MMQETRYKHLFTPMRIGKLDVKNRIAYAPVGTGISTNSTSAFDEADEGFYVARAKGGAGLIFTGAVQTDLEVDKYTPGTLGVWNISHNPTLFKYTAARMADRVHSYGTKIFIQLTLGVGRNSGMKSPSELPSYAAPDKMSPALTTEELKKKIEYLINGAVVAKECGFDGVEVHAMHFGYLLDELAMDICNKRTDEYGGNFENSMRAAKEIIEGIKEKCGQDYPVSMRLGLKSYMKGFNEASLHGDNEVGRTLEDSVKIGKYLEKIGYDMLSVDAGTYDSYYYCYPPMYMKMGINITLGESMKKAVDIPVLVCGRMHTPEICEDAIAGRKADGVVIGRAMIADPDFAIKAKRNQSDEIRPCLSCNMGCRGRMQSGLGLSCAINPLVHREETFGLAPALIKKKVMVIGAGVAGLEAARAASQRGHDVTVYDKRDSLGGILNVAGIPDFKEEDLKLIKWYEKQLSKQRVHIILNTEVTKALILKENPEVVISAMGAAPIIPKIDGINHPKAVTFVDAMQGTKEIGEQAVVVGGGLVGCETALYLAQQGKKVTVVEFLDEILKSGSPTPIMNKLLLLDLFQEYDVQLKTSCALYSINDTGAVIKTAEGMETLEADTVVLAVGMRAVQSIIPELEQYNIETYSIGDERRAANIYHAVSSGYEIGRAI